METRSFVENHESGFKALFTHATVGIIIVDAAGSVIHANPFICQMLGYTEEALGGKDISILIPEDLRIKHGAHIRAYFRNPINRPMGQGMELLAVKRNGEKLHVEISLCSYPFNNQQFAVAFITDITRQILEAQKLETYRETLEALVSQRTEELHHALERERQIGYAKSRFVSLASHELRTPLSTILSSASLISRYNENLASENINKHVARIKTAVTSLTQILNDFLSLDKLEQGAVKVNVETFHPGQLISELVEELEYYLKPGQFIEYIHVGDETIHTDRNILKNILLNLLSNASKYSSENRPIMLTIAIKNNVTHIAVTDQGIGIPATELNKLFSLFYRGSNVGTIKGTGLGLNIISKYVSLLGGHIAVSTVENSGSTFTITLPDGEGQRRSSRELTGDIGAQPSCA